MVEECCFGESSLGLEKKNGTNWSTRSCKMIRSQNTRIPLDGGLANSLLKCPVCRLDQSRSGVHGVEAKLSPLPHCPMEQTC
ncbi:hypothetical protein RchiOBHm_Chr3g0494741 [Rosa chinensis]|uniref:Uncharacterized protein n=1 Tax=Rosa chinensis TaxID=74649 RepID=A0A2P6RH22_ROSCH|nr:hypothetical protein RchiOBHm_Chr3g0494741 [Rosa chinensis]